MIQWVYERASKARLVSETFVATDDERIQKEVESFGGRVIMTSGDLPSGTDRVARAAERIDAEVIINLQGDEPFVKPQLLDDLARVFENSDIEMATPVTRITTPRDLDNPNLVRVTRDKNGFALYFTRSVIPYIRGITDRKDWIRKHPFYKHVGIYAYRRAFLYRLTALPESNLEKAERLEQLRVLENGYRIFTVETPYHSICVDTEQDLTEVNKLIHSQRQTTI